MSQGGRYRIKTSGGQETGFIIGEGKIEGIIDFGQITAGETTDRIVVKGKEQPTRKISGEIPIKNLYSNEVTRGPDLNNAIRLLSESIELAQEALDFHKNEDIFGSEDSMQKLHLILPELFCCRTLGDGFGMIVTALYHFYQNLDGEPFAENQIIEIKSLLEFLFNEPFMPTETAIDKIIKMEDVGLKFEIETLKPESLD